MLGRPLHLKRLSRSLSRKEPLPLAWQGIISGEDRVPARMVGVDPLRQFCLHEEIDFQQLEEVIRESFLPVLFGVGKTDIDDMFTQ